MDVTKKPKVNKSEGIAPKTIADLPQGPDPLEALRATPFEDRVFRVAERGVNGIANAITKFLNKRADKANAVLVAKVESILTESPDVFRTVTYPRPPDADVNLGEPCFGKRIYFGEEVNRIFLDGRKVGYGGYDAVMKALVPAMQEALAHPETTAEAREALENQLRDAARRLAFARISPFGKDNV